MLVRHTVRVLLLDERDRLLLLRSERRGWWQPPGGGVEDGEDVRAAAARELAEETGLADVDVVAEVWRRRVGYVSRGVEVDQHERWILARCAHFAPDTSGLSASEAADLAEWRWWTLPELVATRERLVPADLAVRLCSLLEHGPPDAPISLAG